MRPPGPRKETCLRDGPAKQGPAAPPGLSSCRAGTNPPTPILWSKQNHSWRSECSSRGSPPTSSGHSTKDPPSLPNWTPGLSCMGGSSFLPKSLSPHPLQPKCFQVCPAEVGTQQVPKPWGGAPLRSRPAPSFRARGAGLRLQSSMPNHPPPPITPACPHPLFPRNPSPEFNES